MRVAIIIAGVIILLLLTALDYFEPSGGEINQVLEKERLHEKEYNSRILKKYEKDSVLIFTLKKDKEGIRLGATNMHVV